MSDIDFKIPVDLPVEDSQVRVDPSTASPVPPSGNTKPTVDKDRVKTYLEKYDLVPLVNELLMDVLSTNPDDPIDHMTRWFLRHGATLSEQEGAAPPTAEQLEERNKRAAEVAALHGVNVDYCNNYKLPQLIDELLQAMVREEPEDQGRFAMSWLRWNKKTFIIQQKPAGYEALLQSMNKENEFSAAGQARRASLTPELKDEEGEE